MGHVHNGGHSHIIPDRMVVLHHFYTLQKSQSIVYRGQLSKKLQGGFSMVSTAKQAFLNNRMQKIDVA